MAIEDLTNVVPAPALPATGGDSKAYDVLHLDEAEFAKELGLDQITPENARSVQPRDTDGRFIPKETVLADTTLAKEPEPQPEVVEGTVNAEGSEAKPAEGEQPEAPQAEKPKAPLTKFDVLDAEGKPVEIPEFKLQYKDNGKVVQNDLEKVVHLAQQNSHNARQVQALNETVQAQTQEYQKAVDTIAQYEHHISRMFQNPEVYDEARATWLEANSPEKRAERAEQRVQSIQQEAALNAEAQQVAQFVQGTIMPALTQLAEQHPHVTEDDVLGRLALYIPAYQVNGKVPLANLPKLQQFVETELAQWVAAVHDRRAQDIAAAAAGANKSLQKEQATSQALKRQVGKALAGPGASVASPPTKPTDIKKASDVFNDPLFGGGN